MSKKIHLIWQEKTPTGGLSKITWWWPQCGLTLIKAEYLTESFDEVKCGNCKRTRAYKESQQ